MSETATSLSDLPVVLIVEDEPLVRLLAGEILMESGLRSIEAPNADEALMLLEAKPDIAALLTDVRMPGSIDGFGLARLVSMRWPHVGIVVCSAEALPGEGDLPEGVLFLAKPYQPSSLLAAVRQVVGKDDPPLTIVPIRLAEG